MINLLPPHAKKNLIKDYHMRVTIISLCALFIIEILTIVFFLPSYYVLSLSTNKLTEELTQRQMLSPEENSETSAELAMVKNELALLKPAEVMVGKNPTQLLSEILLVKPSGIEVSSFSYMNEKNKIDMNLSGVASTREDLILFRKNLSAKPNVADVKFGSGFITKKTDVDYAIVISFK